ncbi:Protein of unknown function [Paraburkholderia fungorum]|uniref:DUF3443 domain-containing protein n=1 Tax=Paraburkholderia fungorum TaxID=134537 RepID=A0A1H1A1Q9_9BURK|nr:Protein of unknown function [Paraburkholderia fungorum]
MQLDTGSVGVRVNSSALGAALASSLPAQTGATDDPTDSAPIAQCATFGSGYTWGSIRRADVTIGGKTSGNMPIQVIADGKYATPSDCLQRGGSDLNTVAALGANGVLGIGPLARDTPAAALTPLPAAYYYCTSSTSCTGTRVPLDTQVMNPVANFTSDNNGTIIRLPALPAGGQASATGELIFGVGTRQNNALPSSATVLQLNANGNFTTSYNGSSLQGWLDSGTNVYYFPDSTIPQSNGLYIPATTLNLSAILSASSGTGSSATVPFRVSHGFNLQANGYAAYDSLAAPYYGGFLWGLPFFFGRDVYTVLSGARAGTQTGPFVAFK